VPRPCTAAAGLTSTLVSARNSPDLSKISPGNTSRPVELSDKCRSPDNSKWRDLRDMRDLIAFGNDWKGQKKLPSLRRRGVGVSPTGWFSFLSIDECIFQTMPLQADYREVRTVSREPPRHPKRMPPLLRKEGSFDFARLTRVFAGWYSNRSLASGGRGIF
jgi:hypothetical protein